MEFSVTTILVAVTSLVSIIGFSNREFKNKLLFNAYLIRHENQYYRAISNAFIHADYMHLLINMWVLYMFGRGVEATLVRDFGTKGIYIYLILYVAAIIFSGLRALNKHKDNPRYNALGASGAVSAILYAFIILYPMNRISLYFMIGMPAFVFGILYLWYEVRMDKRGRGRVAHDAHYMGAIFGVVFMLLLDFNYLTNFVDQIKHTITNLIS